MMNSAQLRNMRRVQILKREEFYIEVVRYVVIGLLLALALFAVLCPDLAFANTNYVLSPLGSQTLSCGDHSALFISIYYPNQNAGQAGFQLDGTQFFISTYYGGVNSVGQLQTYCTGTVLYRNSSSVANNYLSLVPMATSSVSIWKVLSWFAGFTIAMVNLWWLKKIITG